jgi:hypothetical protein
MTALEEPRAAEQRYRAHIDAVPLGNHQLGPDRERVLVSRRCREAWRLVNDGAGVASSTRTST